MTLDPPPTGYREPSVDHGVDGGSNPVDRRTGGTAGADGPASGGPPLWVPAVGFAVLTVAAAAVGAGAPRPSAAPGEVATYTATHQGLVVVQATVLFASAIPLVVWSAVAYRRLDRLGVRAPGPLMGFAGGLLAAASVALSALVSWTMAGTAAADPALLGALRTLGFATGAAGFVAPLGLLLAGVAVPMSILGLGPRPLARAGVILAVLGLLSTLSLLTAALDPLLPIGRFGGLLWILAASIVLSRGSGR